MKKFIFGIALFLGGIIAWGIWLITTGMLYSSGGTSTIGSALKMSGGYPIAVIFFIVAIIGLIFAIINISDKK